MSEIQSIGIVGDGQLGRMLTEAAIPLGFEVTVLGMAGPNSPAAQVGARQLEGALTDSDAIHRLASQSDVVTFEIEHINDQALTRVWEWCDVEPSPRSLTTIKDKLMQKQHFETAGLPVGPFMPIIDGLDFNDALHKYGADSVIIKTRRGGYDGRGNKVVTPGESLSNVREYFKLGGPNDLYAEKIIPFQRELAVVGVRDLAGHVVTYPVVETVHEDNICSMVYAPAEIDPRIRAAAEELGRAAIGTFEGAGVFAIEMFQDTADNLLINEVAPRVHNSGHWTIEGAETSQFENHIRAITNMPLGSTDMVAPAAVMINILGTRTTDTIPSFDAAAIAPNVYVHGYGKTPKAARKIGHITVLGDNFDEARIEATIARAQIDV